MPPQQEGYLKYVHIFKCLLSRRWDMPPQQEANEANTHPVQEGHVTIPTTYYLLPTTYSLL